MTDQELQLIDQNNEEAKKKEAIAFKEWCDKYEASIANFHEEFFTTSELYDKYKEENP